MGNRLSKIYTRTGDDGTTGLGDGSRVDKDDSRIEAFGTVDELNSQIGVILAHKLPAAVTHCLQDVQHDLFDLGGELSLPDYVSVNERYVERLEQQLDQFNEKLPPLKEFILPAGGHATSHTHVARTVCRRAERIVSALAREESIDPLVLPYLNRLSDALFVMARYENKQHGGTETLWDERA